MSLNTVLTQNSGNIGGGTSGNSNVGNGDFASPSDVPDGTLAFFPATPGGNSIDLTSKTIDDFDQIIAVLGTPSGEAPRRTNPLETSGLQTSGLGFVSPQAQVFEVTPQTVSSETEVGVKITEQVGRQPKPVQAVSTIVDSGYTAQQIAQALADNINDLEDPINEGAHGVSGDMNVSASASGGVLTITADNAGDIFDIAFPFGGDFSLNQTTAPKPGSGTGEQVIEMEESVFGILGRTQVDDGILGRQDDPRVFADASLDYDLVTIRSETDYNPAINKANRWQDIKVAVATGVSNTSDLTSFLKTSL